MKTHFAIILVLLTLVVLLPGNQFAATPTDPDAKLGAKLIMGPTETNEYPGAPMSTRRTVVATNAPSGPKFGIWLRRHLLWAGKNRNQATVSTSRKIGATNVIGNTKSNKPEPTLSPADSAMKRAYGMRAVSWDSSVGANARTYTNGGHSTPALSLRSNTSTNAPASVNQASAGKHESLSKVTPTRPRVNSATNGDHSTPALSLHSNAGTNVPSSNTNVSVKLMNVEKHDRLSKATAAQLPADSAMNGNRSITPASLRSDTGMNTPANTTASVKLESMETLDDTHRLAIGDKLSFRIEEDKNRLEFGDKLSVRTEDEPTPLLVTDSGELEVPYIGRFPAENKTCKQLAYELKAALEKDYFYKATVILAVDLKAKSRGRVYLTGAVHVPGPLEIPSDEVLTLGKAILRAGGFTDFAERNNVKVTRRVAGSSTTKTLVVDVAEVFDKGRTDRDLPLEPGDLVMVSERLIRF